MIKQAKYRNNVDFIQFDGTNQEEIKEFTGSSYVDTVKFMGLDDFIAIQFEMNGNKRQQINKGHYIVKSNYGYPTPKNVYNFATFSPELFDTVFEVI